MSIKIQYFIDYWKDLTHPKDSIEIELVHSIIYNPKELIKEFIDEIERKNLSNKDNKKFFIDSLGKFSNLDLEALSFIKPTLKLILKEQNSDHSYLLHLLKMAYLKLDYFMLGKESIKELAEILTDDSAIDTKKIKHLTNLIVFELMHKKYSKTTIAKIINNIFSNYQVLSEDQIHTNFPHNIECKNWDRTSSEYEEYKHTLTNFIDNLTEKDRIFALNNYLNKEGEQLRFVFQIKGLKGDNANITIGNVQIYNPKSMQLFKETTEYFNELFEKKIEDNIYYCNGAVTLDVLDTEYAKQEALQILENSLDLVASRYPPYPISITINKFKYYVIDMEGHNRGSGSTNTWEFLTYKDSQELDNSEYDNPIYAQQIAKDKILEVDKKILESMHWKRKAIESNENNEKILWHWVALENLFERKNSSEKTPNVIFEVVSKLLAKQYMYNFAWKHFYKLKEKTDASLMNMIHKDLQLQLPDDLKNNIGLNAKDGTKIYLINLVSNLKKIQTDLNNNSLFFEQLGYLDEIFTDKKKCLELIDKFEKIFFEKLVYVYRVRNKIVHNAHSESNPIIDYYVDFITLASAANISSFMQIRANLSLETNIDVINNIMYEYDKFKLELQEKGTCILLDG